MIKQFNFITKLGKPPYYKSPSKGEGSFGTVYLVKRATDNKLYALKRVIKFTDLRQVKLNGLSEKDKQNALNEIRLLASVQHENVIKYKESFIDVNTQTLCLVMEYAEQGDFLTKIETHFKKGTCFAEYELWSTLIQCLGGLKALHELNIMHRDIKSANILIGATGACKLADFNVSKVVNRPDGLLRTQTGTPYYASPEVWMDKPYSFESDIWSLGCVLFEMAALRPPFKSNDMKGLFQKVTKAQYPPLPNRYSKEFKEIINLMLTPHPRQRPTCEMLLNLPIIQQQVSHLALFDQNVVKAIQQFFKVSSTGHKVNFDYKNSGTESELLSSLRMPKVLKQLQSQLPKPNYKSSNINLQNSQFQQTARVMIEANDSEKSLELQKQFSQVGQVGLTPQVRSQKFAQLEIKNHDRPTSSRVGNFITEQTTRIGLSIPQAKNTKKSNSNSYDRHLSRPSVDENEITKMIKFNPPECEIEVISYPDFLQPGSSKDRDKENQPVRKLQNKASRRNLSPSKQNQHLDPIEKCNDIAERARAIQNLVNDVERQYAPLQQVRNNHPQKSANDSKKHHIISEPQSNERIHYQVKEALRKQSNQEAPIYKMKIVEQTRRNLGEIRQSRLNL